MWLTALPCAKHGHERIFDISAIEMSSRLVFHHRSLVHLQVVCCLSTARPWLPCQSTLERVSASHPSCWPQEALKGRSTMTGIPCIVTFSPSTKAMWTANCQRLGVVVTGFGITRMPSYFPCMLSKSLLILCMLGTPSDLECGQLRPSLKR